MFFCWNMGWPCNKLVINLIFVVPDVSFIWLFAPLTKMRNCAVGPVGGSSATDITGNNPWKYRRDFPQSSSSSLPSNPRPPYIWENIWQGQGCILLSCTLTVVDKRNPVFVLYFTDATLHIDNSKITMSEVKLTESGLTLAFVFTERL